MFVCTVRVFVFVFVFVSISSPSRYRKDTVVVGYAVSGPLGVCSVVSGRGTKMCSRVFSDVVVVLQPAAVSGTKYS